MPKIDRVEGAEWRDLATTFRDYNYRQTWAYGVAVAATSASSSEHVAIRDAGETFGLADVRVKEVPLVGGGVAYIDGGPLVILGDPVGDRRRLQGSLEALIDEYVNKRKLTLRVRLSVNDHEWDAEQARVFGQLGFQDSEEVQAYRTIVVDIDRPIEEVRKQFRQEWRRGLNRASENNLGIRSGTGVELFRDFCGLFRELIERKQFGVNLDADFYLDVHQRMCEEERFQVVIVDCDGAPASGHVSCTLGDTCQWVLGATNDLGRKSRAAYLMHWEAMKLAREKGCIRYDLGGVDPEGNRGVYTFKKGIGGVEFVAPGPFERQPRGVRRLTAKWGERIYRRMLRLRRM